MHIDGDVFALSLTTLFTEGYGANTTPFEHSWGETASITAHFIIEDEDTHGGAAVPRVKGFLACGILRDADSAQGNCTTGEGAQPGSLVWFDKVA